jgi:hypothetical protein
LGSSGQEKYLKPVIRLRGGAATAGRDEEVSRVATAVSLMLNCQTKECWGFSGFARTQEVGEGQQGGSKRMSQVSILHDLESGRGRLVIEGVGWMSVNEMIVPVMVMMFDGNVAKRLCVKEGKVREIVVEFEDEPTCQFFRGQLEKSVRQDRRVMKAVNTSLLPNERMS